MLTMRDLADLEAEATDVITGYLVDEEGDKEFARSQFYNANMKLEGAN